MTLCRCEWVGGDPLYIQYHDEEWGVPVHKEERLFEMLVLGGAQAGLSWLTILRKRENFRKAFEGFDPTKVALYDEDRIAALLSDQGIIRNRQKIRAAVHNAKAFLAVQEERGSFDRYIWQFVNYKTIRNYCRTLQDIPVTTIEAQTMSKDLLKRGFKFVGPTICYAFMQAVGMVNDHQVRCFRFDEVS